ncbi:sensor domain-containing diguanylate cyclase [Hypericibacter sp.]|uniref:sensor domain-containing diguanylate cyclase n=1 Tax=Hypericibacter sp. TaxID=2705401 RepID=UPI003D6D586F
MAIPNGDAQPASPYADLATHWPGPCALLAATGRVFAANAGGEALLAVLAPDEADRAELAARKTACTLEPVILPSPSGSSTVEPSLIPIAGGLLLIGRDVTLQARIRSALIESRQRFKDLVDISSDFSWETDATGRFVFVSPQGGLGYPAVALLGRDPATLAIEEDEALLSEQPFAARERVEARQMWMRRADGAAARVAISALPLHDSGGEIIGARGLCRDITAADAQEAALLEARHHERLLAYIARTIREEVEPGAMLNKAASTLAHALGAELGCIWRFENGPPRLVAQSGTLAVPAIDLPGLLQGWAKADRNAVETPQACDTESLSGLALVTSYRRAANGAVAIWRRHDQAPSWSKSDHALMREIAGHLGIALAQISQHDALAALANTDALTGLLNRRSFTADLERWLQHARRTGRGGTLLYLDLDNFKPINDRFGHERGDAVLVQVADRLRRGSRAGDLAARLGGDEFALWAAETDEAGALAKAQGLIATVRECAGALSGVEPPLGISIGIACYRPTSAEAFDGLLARADEAMYRAKRAGKNRCELAPPARVA